MQISLSSKGVLAVIAGAVLVIALVVFAAFGLAEEGPSEIKGGFALGPDGGQIAYHYTQAAREGISKRGIRLHTRDGTATHVIEGEGSLHLHSPTFSTDGRKLIIASACWAETCPKGLHGSLLLSIDLTSGTWTALTDGGLKTPFWDFGYVNEIPESYPAQIVRSNPVATKNGIVYLMSAGSPSSVASARDFAPRRLSPTDSFLIQNKGGHVGFRGTGSLAPFGPNAVLVLAGAARGGALEATSRDGKSFAYMLDARDGRVLQSWGKDALDRLGLSRPPSTETATGTQGAAQAYLAAGTEIISLTPSGPGRYLSAQSADALRIWDIALSGNGQHLLEVVELPGSGLPVLSYGIIDTAKKARQAISLSSESPTKIITIQ